MALGKCPDCGSELPDMATACPSCGRPVGVAAPPPVATAPPAKKGMSTVVIVLLVLAGLCVVGGGLVTAILFPVFSQAKLSAQRSASLSNMKNLAIGALMYQADYDDMYPMKFSTNDDMRELLMPYIRNEALFETLNPDGGEVLPNNKLEEFPTNEIMDYANTVMVFETKDWPNGGRNYAFTDGHAKYLPSGADTSVNFDPQYSPYPDAGEVVE